MYDRSVFLLITGTPTKHFSPGLAKRGCEPTVTRTRNVRVIIVGPVRVDPLSDGSGLHSPSDLWICR